MEIKYQDFIVDLRNRSRNTLYLSYIFMLFILISLLIGILVFINASDIADNDLGEVKNFEKRITILEDKIVNNDTIIELLSGKLSKTKEYQVLVSDPDLINHKERLDSLSKMMNQRLISGIVRQNIDSTSYKLEKQNDYFEVLIAIQDVELDLNDPKNLYLTNYSKEVKFGNYKTIFNDPYAFGKIKNFLISDYAFGKLSDNYNLVYNKYNIIREERIKQTKNKIKIINDSINTTQDKNIQLKLQLANTKLKKNDFLQNKSKVKDQEKNIYKLLQVNITRFGTLILILFFIKILIPQYRYYIKLSNFYTARADALELLELLPLDMDLESLTNLLTPNYNFTKSPDTPYESLIEILKEIRANQIKP